MWATFAFYSEYKLKVIIWAQKKFIMNVCVCMCVKERGGINMNKKDMNECKNIKGSVIANLIVHPTTSGIN